MTVASFFQKYSVGCILNYVRLNTVFAQWDFPLHYKNKRYVPPIKFVENQNNLGNTSVTHGMTLYRKGKCLGANSLLSLVKYPVYLYSYSCSSALRSVRSQHNVQ
jgi:hypothetical protein